MKIRFQIESLAKEIEELRSEVNVIRTEIDKSTSSMNELVDKMSRKDINGTEESKRR